MCCQSRRRHEGHAQSFAGRCIIFRQALIIPRDRSDGARELPLRSNLPADNGQSNAQSWTDGNGAQRYFARCEPPPKNRARIHGLVFSDRKIERHSRYPRRLMPTMSSRAGNVNAGPSLSGGTATGSKVRFVRIPHSYSASPHYLSTAVLLHSPSLFPVNSVRLRAGFDTAPERRTKQCDWSIRHSGALAALRELMARINDCRQKVEILIPLPTST